VSEPQANPEHDPKNPAQAAANLGMIPEPSEEFLEAFREGSSGMVVDCEFCGRVYFATQDSGDYEEGELENLRAQAEKDPDKYIEVDCFTTRILIDGKGYAYGCKCNKLRRYEDWIWSNRRGIVAYLKARTEKRLKAAAEDSEAVQAHLKIAEGADGAETMEREILRNLLNKYPDENGVYSLHDHSSGKDEFG
jgi:hypothetical protein